MCAKVTSCASASSTPCAACPRANESLPQGYMLGMAREVGGREWKVETWLLQSPAPHPEWIEERMTEEGRRTILQLKHERNSRQFYASSHDITPRGPVGKREGCE